MGLVETDSARQTELRVTGIACVIGAMALFSINDMTIKFLSGDYALHQVVLVRSVVALAMLLGVIVPLGGGYRLIRTRRLGMHGLRGLCVVVANSAFFAGLAVLPLADAVAIFFISPLLITLLSVVLLGETVGAWRWVAVIAGLTGVVVMLRPGSAAFQPAAILPIAAAAAYAMLAILTRKIGGTERAITMAVYIQLVFILVSSSMGLAFGDGRLADGGSGPKAFLFREWVWPTGSDWLVLVALGVANGLAALLVSQAYRLAEAALIAPFEYVAMPLAVFWGVVVFGEWPDGMAWAGIALILGGGLYMFLREAMARRRIATRRPPPLR